MTTIKEIAALAEVSISTVSRVLNHHPYVSDDKRNRVQEVINELNYHQNMNAIHLVKGKTHTIGVIIPYINHPFFHAVVGGIMNKAFEEGYSVLCCATNYEKEKELTYLDMLKGKHLDGLIICSRTNSWETILPYTSYGTIISCEKNNHLPCAYTNHYDVFTTGMRYLIEQGHEHIGYATGRKNSLSSEMRYMAYADALLPIHQPVNDPWVFTECYALEDGKRIIRQLEGMENRPTAIIANGDVVAAGIIIQAEQIGLNVPEDLSVMGLDNDPISEALHLTTLDVNITQIGETAFSLFLSGTIKQIQIPFQLVKRKSISKRS